MGNADKDFNKVVLSPAGAGMSFMANQLMTESVIDNGQKLVVVGSCESLERLAREGRKHSSVNEAKAKAVVKAQVVAPYYKQFDKRKF